MAKVKTAIFNDPRTHKEIARDFSISPATVSHIKNGRLWRGIGEENG